jgi:hypothetical protein
MFLVLTYIIIIIIIITTTIVTVIIIIIIISERLDLNRLSILSWVITHDFMSREYIISVVKIIFVLCEQNFCTMSTFL